MSWQDQLHGDSLTWVLERNDPGVRYLALRDLVDPPPSDSELKEAQQQAHTSGPISALLDAMQEEGYWDKPGAGYNRKYRSTVWSLITLAQLGARASADPRIARACGYLLDHALTKNGQFSVNGTPSSTIDCLQGNLCAALLALGYEDPRLEAAFEWMARTVTGEGLAPAEDRKAPLRYYAYQCGPGFACGANYGLPCAWGAAKVMLGFSLLPVERRTPLIERAIQQGVDFLFGTDPALAEYPTHDNLKPSRNWWKFGFPVFYVTDILQIAEALVRLGYGKDERLSHALHVIREKQDHAGRWPLEYSYEGKIWVDFGEKRQPNKWVTVRALQVLKAA